MRCRRDSTVRGGGVIWYWCLIVFFYQNFYENMRESCLAQQLRKTFKSQRLACCFSSFYFQKLTDYEKCIPSIFRCLNFKRYFWPLKDNFHFTMFSRDGILGLQFIKRLESFASFSRNPDSSLVLKSVKKIRETKNSSLFMSSILQNGKQG